MNITPSIDENSLKENLREKIAGFLVGLGFNEILPTLLPIANIIMKHISKQL